MRRPHPRSLLALGSGLALAAAMLPSSAVAADPAASGPAPGSPAYVARDAQNILDA